MFKKLRINLKEFNNNINDKIRGSFLFEDFKN